MSILPAKRQAGKLMRSVTGAGGLVINPGLSSAKTAFIKSTCPSGETSNVHLMHS